MKRNELKLGDVVMLKSGSDLCTVISVDNSHVDVTYFDINEHRFKVFTLPFEALLIAKETDKQTEY